jgi:hypothetical protein
MGFSLFPFKSFVLFVSAFIGITAFLKDRWDHLLLKAAVATARKVTQRSR